MFPGTVRRWPLFVNGLNSSARSSLVHRRPALNSECGAWPGYRPSGDQPGLRRSTSTIYLPAPSCGQQPETVGHGGNLDLLEQSARSLLERQLLEESMARPRGGEVGRGAVAEWADIDLEEAEQRYTVTKTDTPHVVTLTRPAFAIFASCILYPDTAGSLPMHATRNKIGRWPKRLPGRLSGLSTSPPDPMTKQGSGRCPRRFRIPTHDDGPRFCRAAPDQEAGRPRPFPSPSPR